MKQLQLYLDENKLLRCAGRIHNAPTTELAKFLYLLPSKHTLTNMTVMETHKHLDHVGASYTTTALLRMFWIPSIRQQVKKLLHRCVTCNKLTGKPYTAPDPPPFPTVREKQCKPFTIIGVDFTGALFVRERKGEERKVYICLFICTSTRAVHIEVVPDLTVESFLLAFRKLASLYNHHHQRCCLITCPPSLPLQMSSDNWVNPTRSKNPCNARTSLGNSFPNVPVVLGILGTIDWID